ncbi:hypothetical protein JCM18899A_39820 [Nocardioides sp. AN3]
MAHGKAALGKIFISHSSVNKAWVRRFDRRLRSEGYDTWLDEREIDVGDALAARISAGVRDAKIVIVVVSEASLSSRWLRYELDIATQRMIAGDCRVMPVLIDQVDVPTELEGRLYADMRPGRRGGFNSVIRTLTSEAAKYPIPSSPTRMDSEQSWVRHQAYRDFLGELADGGWFSASMDVSATRSIDFEGMSISGQDVPVNFVSAYGFSEGQLTPRDWNDWSSRVLEDLNETCGLLVTERPANDQLSESLGIRDRIGLEQTKNFFKRSGLLVMADLSEQMNDGQAKDVLRRAHSALAEGIRNSEPPVVDLHG